MVFGIVALVGLVGVLVSRNGDSEEIVEAGATTTLPDEPFDLFADPDSDLHPDVNPLQCFDLMDDRDVEVAMGVGDRPFDERSMSGRKQGESCTKFLDSDDRFSVTISPGEPGDFLPGAVMLGVPGVPGVPVSDVGEESLWFGGEQAEGGGQVSLLAVRQTTDLGVLYFRLQLSRPDSDSATQLEALKKLAISVLPRFPGMGGTASVLPLVVLCELVSDEEAEGVLADYRGQHPAARDEIFVISNWSGLVDLRFPGEETCQKLILAEIYVEIQRASAADFEAGAELAGVAGERVTGIGEEAVWFSGVPFSGSFSAPHEQGVLSIKQGEAFFRIVLALPDTENADQLDIATDLASNALTHIPGFVPVDTAFAAAFEEEEVDRSGLSFVDNLLVKAEAGEWSLGEGLVATLQLLAGEVDEAAVLRHSEVAVREGTGVIAMAYEYLNDGPDPEAKAEIARLLDLLVFTNDELEAMAGIDTTTSAQESRSAVIPVAFSAQRSQPDSTHAGLRDAHVAAQQSVEECRKFFNPDESEAIPGVGHCLEWRAADLPGDLAGKYRIFIPVPSFPQGGWTEDHYKLGLEALEHSAKWYEGEGVRLVEATGGFLAEGKMPPVNLVFSVSGGGDNAAEAITPEGEPCGIVVYAVSQRVETKHPGALAHIIAHELAHCFQEENFEDQNDVKYRFVQWREEGLADFLAHVVYPTNNFEWTALSYNDKLNRTTTLMDVSYGNFLFFQYLDQNIGMEGIFRLVGSLPTSGGRKEQEEALAEFRNMKTLFHGYAEAMIDGTIVDNGTTLVPYKKEYGTAVITGTASVTVEIKPFGLNRVRNTVGECKIAHFKFDWQNAKDSARPLANPNWSRFPVRIPASSGDAHDRVFVLTTTEDTKVTFAVTEFKDDPACEDDEGGTVPASPGYCEYCGRSQYYRKEG